MTTSSEIERHLNEQRRSGKSAAAYCQERGIAVGKFYGWKKRKKEVPLGFARVQTDITVQIEIGAVKLHVPLEALNAVLSELNKR
jgi:hypothetical protein